jgi:peptidoglycan/xylan/chitin deacetylase (PgdA/CDA1 family)
MTSKIFLKRTLGKIARLRPMPKRRKVALMYHSIGETQWAIPERMFRAQMEWLRTSARLVSLYELLEEKLEDPLQVAITFDDGYSSLHEFAAPTLKDVGTSAAVFLVAGCVGEIIRHPSSAIDGHYPNEEFLSWHDIDGLVAAGWTVGSHGMDHLDLTQVSSELARNQLETSKRAIEERLSLPCIYFSYTWGRHNANLRQLVAQAGYHYAFSSQTAPVHDEVNSLAVPRINVSSEYTMADFQALIRGDWDYLGWLHRMKAG